ncbi:nitroreductase family deazaflavin-dependent oxidoreductase [Nocardiopsis exhalans]|uniref:Nitroreductase family deazaflavin-dependent oxidoreductase n=1 Tax=Nocardiopsis exhalans TaxID=163604 RepID=A0ABY5DHH0_9ACTN|nr:nitroreductase family deazaflavin-dependent oxidoreductase [Nocardiopsis exhalans]USY22643.1 nitroreductase family deazaflavin-dependent oxidoreductase [Nocardiopsis exhalans]
MGTTEHDHSPPRLPPRWFVRAFWAGHRLLCRVTGGRAGLSRPKPGKYGMLRLHTVGRRTGKPRAVILAYFEDGPDLVLLAMNGWGDPPPAWWLNLSESPEARVDLVGERRSVRAREAQGEERERLWARWGDYSKSVEELDGFAALRSRRTPVVLLEPNT